MTNLKSFSFELLAQDGAARAGIFHTPHGSIPTPVFAPVGTQASVKALTNQQLADLQIKLTLANTYHLYLRPGDELIHEFGGVQQFMNWPGPMLTDSGGFQVFSLAENRKIDPDGVTFKSHIDGSTHRFTPEKAIQIQENLGADIIMAFDECAPPYERSYNQHAMERTHRWLERCIQAKQRTDQALFGIIQGGIFPDLRTESAKFVASQELPGIAIGGLSVGETKAEMYSILELITPLLPENKPRYLMGVGAPDDLVEGIFRGIDLFDCVLPTRLARHHAALTRTGRLNLMNARFIHDPTPIDSQCACYTCQNHSRAYLRHLISVREMLSATLISIHNIHTLIQLVNDYRTAIIAGQSQEFVSVFRAAQTSPSNLS